MTDSEQRCAKCVLPAQYPAVSFEGSDGCNYCKEWHRQWKNVDFEKQSVLLENILSRHRGKSRPYDCLVGLSGGKDSCYAALVLKQRDMNPLACTFDNGFMTESALRNIDNTVNTLGMGHIFVRYDAGFLRPLYRHFLLRAGEFCTVCNIGIKSTWYRLAKSYGITLLVSGQSIRTEANPPKEFYCPSSGYFRNVAKSAFGKKEIDGFVYVSQLQRAVWHWRQSPLYLQLPSYMPWNEEEFIAEIQDRLNWQGQVGEEHTDCTMSEAKEYLNLKRFQVTEHTAKLAALIRDRQLSRDEALKQVQRQVDRLNEHEPVIREEITSELGISEDELDQGIHAPRNCYLSSTDSMLSAAKRLFEAFRFR